MASKATPESSMFTSGANTDVFGSLSNLSDGELQPGLMPWDNSDPFTSYSTRILLQRVLKCYVRQAVVFVGIPAN
ncbi:hypothetical protein ACOMHN_013432 [Nucella lapillus]